MLHLDARGTVLGFILSVTMLLTAAIAQPGKQQGGGAPHAAPAARATPAAPQASAPRAAPQISAPHAAPRISAPQPTVRAPSGPPPTAQRAVPREQPRQQERRQEERRAVGQQERRQVERPADRGRAAVRERPSQQETVGRGNVGREQPSGRDNTRETVGRGNAGRDPAQPPGRDNVTGRDNAGRQTPQTPSAVRPNQPAQAAGINRPEQVLRNQSLANLRPRNATERALTQSAFHGRYSDHAASSRRRHHGPFVIGWAGPLFWPFAYYDFVDYTFYPHAYDTFWPSAYDDVYAGVFGSYAYGYGDADEIVGYGDADETVGRSAESTDRASPAQRAAAAAQLCTAQANRTDRADGCTR
jgi:hypothetical protein